MEFSAKKFMRKFDRWLNTNNGYGLEFTFDQESNPEYTYVIKDRHYVIRVSKDFLGTILSTTQARFVKIEPIIQATANDADSVEFRFSGLEDINGIEVCVFKNKDEDIKYINAKFFKEFYNKPIMKEVPDNVKFIGNSLDNQPLVMLENGEAVAMFLPIVKRV